MTDKDDIIQAVKDSEGRILKAVEGGRQQTDTLEQTVRPELRYIREALNKIAAWIKKMGA